jgi:hypothetical protein
MKMDDLCEHLRILPAKTSPGAPQSMGPG